MEWHVNGDSNHCWCTVHWTATNPRYQHRVLAGKMWRTVVEVFYFPSNIENAWTVCPISLALQCRIVEVDDQLAVIIAGSFRYRQPNDLKDWCHSMCGDGLAYFGYLGLLHQSGHAHNLLRSEASVWMIWVNKIRPTLGRFIPSGPDPKASHCNGLLANETSDTAFGYLRRSESLLHCSIEVWKLPDCVCNQPAIRQYCAVLASFRMGRDFRWTDGFGLGTQSTKFAKYHYSTSIEVDSSNVVSMMWKTGGLIDLWGNLFASSSIDEVIVASVMWLWWQASIQRGHVGSRFSCQHTEADRRGFYNLRDWLDWSDINSGTRSGKASGLVSIQEVGINEAPDAEQISTTGFLRSLKKQRQLRSNTSTSSQFLSRRSPNSRRGRRTTVIVWWSNRSRYATDRRTFIEQYIEESRNVQELDDDLPTAISNSELTQVIQPEPKEEPVDSIQPNADVEDAEVKV